jgi:hypothetical protein
VTRNDAATQRRAVTNLTYGLCLFNARRDKSFPNYLMGTCASESGAAQPLPCRRSVSAQIVINRHLYRLWRRLSAWGANYVSGGRSIGKAVTTTEAAGNLRTKRPLRQHDAAIAVPTVEIVNEIVKPWRSVRDSRRRRIVRNLMLAPVTWDGCLKWQSHCPTSGI